MNKIHVLFAFLVDLTIFTIYYLTIITNNIWMTGGSILKIF